MIKLHIKVGEVAGLPKPFNVLLDGKPLNHVVELDEAKGWLDRFTGRINGDEMEIERLTGEVVADIPASARATYAAYYPDRVSHVQ